MPITALPPAPLPTDTPAEFNPKSFNLVAALATFVSDANTLQVDVNNKATIATTQAALAATNGATQVSLAEEQVSLAAEQVALAEEQVSLAAEQVTLAAASATAAAGSALVAGAVAWVSGTTYAAGDTRYSPINLQTYRRISAGAGTTDPSLDATNWASAILALPPQAGNSGKFVTTDGTSASWTNVPAPGLVFISAATASNVASVDITGLSGEYATYMLVCENVLPSASGSFLSLRTSTDGGVTYASSASHYKSSQTGIDFGGGSLSSNLTAAQIRLCNIAQEAEAQYGGSSVILYIHKPSSPSGACNMSWSARGYNGSYQIGQVAGSGQSLSFGVNALRVFFSATNIASGEFRLYGMRAS